MFNRSAIVLLLIAAAGVQSFGQAFTCKKAALAAIAPLPKLEYECREDLPDHEAGLLKAPERLEAIDAYMKSLETFAPAEWWSTTLEDLNACEFRKKAGTFLDEERDAFKNGEYVPDVSGNELIRIVRAADPCYQTGYGGSAIFLLYRKGGRTYATKIIDGFYSRADAPIDTTFATFNGQRLIEVSTSSGGLSPTITNYYFTIDIRTNRAVAKNLFRNGKTRTNRITSMMLLDDASAYGLAVDVEPLIVFKNNKLQPGFSVFKDTFKTFGPDNHQKFVRMILRWNGRFFEQR